MLWQTALFKVRPSSEEVTTALTRIMFTERIRPKHLIVDQGPEFNCEHFKTIWCKAMSILPRFGAVGKHGSIAVVERFHRTMKEILHLITVPEDQAAFERELRLIVDWYNEQRPHDTLSGRTPNEVYFSRPAANEQPRFEPRKRWPRGSWVQSYRAGGGPTGFLVCLSSGYFGFHVGCSCVNHACIFFENAESNSGFCLARLLASPISSLRL